MVRAAAKNHGSVAVVTDPSRYADVLAALAAGGFTLDQRRALAAEAFAHTAAYDVAVASWFASAYAPDETAREAGWPRVAGALWQRADVLRYGENPHQRAGDRGPGPADQGRVHRGGDRAGVRRRGAGHPVREQERPAAALPGGPRGFGGKGFPPRAGGGWGGSSPRDRTAPGDRRHAAAIRRPGR